MVYYNLKRFFGCCIENSLQRLRVDVGDQVEGRFIIYVENVSGLDQYGSNVGDEKCQDF